MDSLDPFDQVEPTKSSIDAKINNAYKLNKLFLLIIFTFVILWYALCLGGWIYDQGKTIAVQPFEIVETNIAQSSRGDLITNLLCFELQKIKEINRKGPIEGDLNPIVITSLDSISSFNTIMSPSSYYVTSTGPTTSNIRTNNIYLPPITLGPMPVDYSISQLGNAGMSGISLSVGQIILSLKGLTHHQGRTITGNLQRYGSNLRIIAILNDPDSDGERSNAWEVRRTLPKENSSIGDFIPAMVEDLAFQIAHDISEKDLLSSSEYPKTWQAFKNWTLGWEAYNMYNSTRRVEDLDRARNMALLAKSSEPYYSGSYKLLFSIGLAYLNRGEYNESICIFQNITQFQSGHVFYLLGVVYTKKGLYNDAIKAYDLAIRAYKETIKTDHGHSEARTILAKAWNGKGIALSSLGMHDEAIKAYDNTIKLNTQQITPE